MRADPCRFLRPSIRRLVPYSSARSRASGEALTLLDANENSYGSCCRLVTEQPLERYPDPMQRELKRRIGALKGVPEECIFLGNGSDEALDLLVRCFCEPGGDCVVTTPPTYGMFEVIAGINGVHVRTAALGPDFELIAERLTEAAEPPARIFFFCSPNNPTGNLLGSPLILDIAGRGDSIVVVDEAYIDFASSPSLVSELSAYPNLVVVQTLSKSWGMAGARLGMAFAAPEIIQALNRIKFPYNVSTLTQYAALGALQEVEIFQRGVSLIVKERRRLSERIAQLPGVVRVFPSDANFLLCRFSHANAVFDSLLKHGIVVRNRSDLPGCDECLRITVGNREENDRLLAALAGEPPAAARERRACCRRRTAETDVWIALSLDRPHAPRIDTGIGFLDHLLEQMAFHSGVGLTLEALGDLDVDEHHTLEDSAIGLGQAMRDALGERRGVERYGFTAPMDESLARVAIDLSGRGVLVFQGEFRSDRVGGLSSELVEHFLASFCHASGITANISFEGENDHHKAEAIFKAFGRSLQQALRLGSDRIPSTKGVL